MFTFYSDRIEILSNGALSPKLSMSDFYKGKSAFSYWNGNKNWSDRETVMGWGKSATNWR